MLLLRQGCCRFCFLEDCMPPKKDIPKDVPKEVPAPVAAPIAGSGFKVQAGVNFTIDGPGGEIAPYIPEP